MIQYILEIYYFKKIPLTKKTTKYYKDITMLIFLVEYHGAMMNVMTFYNMNTFWPLSIGHECCNTA